MRPLTEDEMKLVLEKLAKYLGNNVVQLVDRKGDVYVFRLHKGRVLYLTEKLLKMSGCIPRKQLVILAGTCIGKFTKSNKFMVSITCLDYLAKYAKCKIWLKTNGEQGFLYGNNIIKRHVGRITEDALSHSGVVVFSMSDMPLGFGVLSRHAKDLRNAAPEVVAVFHEADVGEYLRHECELI